MTALVGSRIVGCRTSEFRRQDLPFRQIVHDGSGILKISV